MVLLQLAVELQPNSLGAASVTTGCCDVMTCDHTTVGTAGNVTVIIPLG